MTGVRAFWKASVALWEEFFTIILVALVGFALALPLVTLPFVIAGHFTLADQIAEEKSVSWRTWWDGARRHWKVGAIWLLVYTLTVAILGSNLRFYSGMESSWAPVLQGFFLMLLALWLAANLYVLPLYLLQAQQRLLLAYRNAAVMAASDPLTLAVLLILLLTLSLLLYTVALPLLIVIPPFAAILSAIAVRLRLQKEGLWTPFEDRAASADRKTWQTRGGPPPS